MGRPKLILPVGGQALIARVVTALREGGVGRVVVVPPPPDAPGAETLRREAEEAGAEVVVPNTRPPDMRTSFEIGLAFLDRDDRRPATVLLVPADSPGLNPTLVARVIAGSNASPESMVVPVVGERRGHPIALPWGIAQAVKSLPEGVGVNALVALHANAVETLEVHDPAALDDLDTPEDYQKWAEAANS